MTKTEMKVLLSALAEAKDKTTKDMKASNDVEYRKYAKRYCYTIDTFYAILTKQIKPEALIP